MAQRALTLAVDKSEVRGGKIYLGWADWLAVKSGSHSLDLCVFPLVLVSCLLQVRNGNCEGICKGKSISKELSLRC